MLQNDTLVAIVAVHTAENEPLKVWGWLGQTQTSNFAKKFELLSAAQPLIFPRLADAPAVLVAAVEQRAGETAEVVRERHLAQVFGGASF